MQQRAVRRMGKALLWAGAAGLAAAILPLGAEAQTGQVAGRVLNADSGQPVTAVQLSIQGTPLGVLTGSDGSFVIPNVSAGVYVLLGQRLGFQPIRQEGVTVTAGGIVRVDLQMSPTVLTLQGIVATGLVDPVEGVRSPISVGRVSRETLAVPVSGGAVQNLQGMVAGVTMNRVSGQPGSDIGVILRTPTSVLGSGAPMIVVDGVILGGATTNIESLDIESIEVIRGAAAASLYGSRAASGVISIKTARGSSLAIGQTRFTARTEIGISDALDADGLPTHHQYLMNAAGTSYANLAGADVTRQQRVPPAASAALQFMDKPYPGPVYDNIAAIYQGGDFASHNLTVMQNSQSTNLALTLNSLTESGPLENNDGYARNSLRLNVDQRVLNSMSLGMSVYHSRDKLDIVDAAYSSFLLAPPDIDLLIKDDEGLYVQAPDPTVDYENPLWRQASREAERQRARTLANVNARWAPHNLVEFAMNVSYDREDSKTRTYTPKGTPTSITQDIPSDGSLEIVQQLTDTWNAEAQVSLRRDFGQLNVRSTLRGLVEQNRREDATASGTNFFVSGVPRLDQASIRSSGSFEEEVRSLGYLWDTAFDYGGKYILTVLGRRDGSSLFGPDRRWHNYYRVAGAWRLSQEPWFSIPNVDEFKLRYARGTAGGRPLFASQYETWNATASGVSKGTLGNRELRPEHTTEQEVALEAVAFGRFGLELTYAWQRTTDQLVDLSLPALSGYTAQWSNIGVLEGNTIEFTLESRLVETPSFSWTSTFVFDRSLTKIAEWPSQNCRAPAFRNWCSGRGMYEIWGFHFVMDMDELAVHHGGALVDYADEFMVNDDGYVVWVGSDNRYTDGFSKNLWGTSKVINGITYNWGIPFFEVSSIAETVRQQIGDARAKNFGLVNAFRFGQFLLHAQMSASLGGELTYTAYRTATTNFRHPEMDQFEKPPELKKPVLYYSALEGARGNQASIENANYLKLRALSLTYQMNPSQISRLGLSRLGLESVQLGVVGRNVLTLHSCLCPDPEQGLDLSNRSSTVGGGYPTSRTWTAEMQVAF